MQPEQQRSLDQALIEGRLVDAIGLYRAATGATLADAERYVNERNVTLTGQPSASTPWQAPASPSFPQTDSYTSVSETVPAILTGKALPRLIMGIVALVVIVPLVAVAISFGAIWHVVSGITNGKGLGSLGSLASLASLASIVREPYYPDVVKQIQKDPKFQDALGTPIVVEDGGVFCNFIHDDAAQKKANCTIPAHGPKAAGIVNVQIVDTATTLDLGAWLHIGNREIPIGS